MEKPTIEKSIILLEEIRKLLIANYNDRPNAVASFGTAKLNSRDVKEIFDKQFKFLAEKHNTLASGTAAEIEKHKSDVSDELDAMQKTLDTELEDHKAATAAEIAKHKAEVDGALEAQDEEINGAVLTATEAERIAKEVQARADNGEFIGETGKQGEKGDPGSIKFIIVTELPEEDIDESAIYLVPAENPSEDNKFIEYFYANGRWEMLPGGGINVDLTDYLKKTDAEDNYVSKVKFTGSGYRIHVCEQNGVLKEVGVAYPSMVPSGYRIPMSNGAGNLTVADPKEDQHAATKKYVDDAIAAITNGEEVAY